MKSRTLLNLAFVAVALLSAHAQAASILLRAFPQHSDPASRVGCKDWSSYFQYCRAYELGYGPHDQYQKRHEDGDEGGPVHLEKRMTKSIKERLEELRHHYWVPYFAHDPLKHCQRYDSELGVCEKTRKGMRIDDWVADQNKVSHQRVRFSSCDEYDRETEAHVRGPKMLSTNSDGHTSGSLGH